MVEEDDGKRVFSVFDRGVREIAELCVSNVLDIDSAFCGPEVLSAGH